MKRKPRIAVIGLKGLPALGGAATVGQNIIEQLKNEYDFIVYSTSSHTDEKTGDYNGYKQIVFDKFIGKRLNTLYYYIVSAIHAILYGNYDLVHLHHRDAAFIIPILKLKYRVLLTLHGFGTYDLSDKWNRFKLYFEVQEKIFTKKADLLTTMSLDDKREIEKKHGLRIVHISNGISTDRNGVRSHNSDLPVGHVMFAAARIVSFKRCDVFLKALRELAYGGPVLVAGDLSNSSNHCKVLKELSVGLNVTFTGLIRNKELLMEYYERAALFVFPSAREAMSMVLLEVASVKTPLICSNIPGNRNIFDEKEVLYFEKDDVSDLSKKISWALMNKREMQDKADRAYQKLLSHYTWDKISRKYSMCYELLLERRDINGSY